VAPLGGPILLVEDDTDTREGLRELLGREGYHVVEACNGQEALDWLRANGQVRLILLDVMMPVMGGAEFRRHQQKDPALAEIPVVALTAAGENVAMALSPSGHLAKPFDLDRLLELIRRHV
jgi:CheY-like chemotaxis protein